MATSKPIFMRPIEITSSNDDISINGFPYPLINGVYSCILAVLNEYKEILAYVGSGTSADVTLVDNGNGVPVIKFEDNATFSLSFNDAVSQMLGSTQGSYSGASSYTLEVQPQFLWVPKYQVANQSRFFPQQKDLFVGGQSKTGLLAGNSPGPKIYYRDLEFHNELASNLTDEGITSNDWETSPGDQRYMHLDYFAEQSRVSMPSESGNVTTKNFWFWPDWNDALGTSPAYPGTATGTSTARQGILFDIDTTPDLFAYCQFDEDGYNPPDSVSMPTGRRYFNAKFKIHTVTDVPDWTAGWTDPYS